ncbi:MAG: hypothetical protein NC397_09275 [Clostridium sp.]|nr:hypothetical protein [Clostridium sp.]
MSGEYVERCTYTNSIGETICFNDGSGLCLDESEISGWSFSANSDNDRIKSFNRGVYSKKLNASIIADSEEQANSIRNKLHDICIVDIESEMPGILRCRDYELECWINEGTHSEYSEWAAFETLELNVISDQKYWIKKSETHYELKGEVIDENDDYDFSIGFPFDLLSENFKANIINDEILPSDFIIKIYGPVQNPSLQINNHLYEVEDVNIEEKEYLVINSLDKTIKHIKKFGEVVNCFSKRNKKSYIFEKIPKGNLPIYSDYELVFDIVLCNRRAEPKW